MSEERNFKFGFISIMGRPNVGKSTLVNQLVGKKVSITSRKPQTTRHRILGIHNDDDSQIVFVDTPGLHTPKSRNERKTINHVTNKTAVASIDGVDLLCLMITADGWSDQDKKILKLLASYKLKIMLLINKIDKLKSVNSLLPLIKQSNELFPFDEIYPLSALEDSDDERLRLCALFKDFLPIEPAGFDKRMATDRSNRFLATELIREQFFRFLGDEVPYSTAVEITQFEKEKNVFRIEADIWVERKSHKIMIIGKEGETLKTIATKARLNCEELLGQKVYLQLWVKVRKGWSDNVRDIYSLGYDEGIE